MKSDEKRQLVVFNQHSSFITIDIVNALAERGEYDEIVLVTGVVNEREDKLNPRVNVIRTSPYIKDSFISRIRSWLSAFRTFLKAVNCKYRRAEILMFTNPPLISFFPWLSRNRCFSVVVFDVYPDALAAGSFVSDKSPLYRVWARANRNLFRQARKIYTISDGMKRRLSKYAEKDKIEIVPLWSSFEAEIIAPSENPFRKEHHLESSFVVMYSGNMGKGCGLEGIIDVAEKLKENKDIIFLFVGDGWSVEALKAKAEKNGLENVVFMPYQDASVLRYSLSAADLAVISLPGATGSISIPNKLYTLIALGRPLLCLTPEDTDLHRILDRYGMGQCFEPRDVEQMADYILRLKGNAAFREKLEKKAIEASRDFSKDNAKKICVK